MSSELNWENFKKILDDETKSQIRQFLSVIYGQCVLEFTVLIHIDPCELKRFGLRDIKFGMRRSLGGSFSMLYFYKDREITPDIDAMKRTHVDTLGVLHACIEQDTDTPEL